MENRIADQIRFYRKQKGLTQEQLAEAMGVSVAAVSKWEQGQSLPEIPMLMELADFFDLSVDALLGLPAARKRPQEHRLAHEAPAPRGQL